jgi:hypothetical protein
MAKATTTIPKTKTVAKLVVTAPGGPRRRAGYSFSPAEATFSKAELGDQAETLVAAWRADPFLKVDMRDVEETDTEETSGDNE